jgi:hypothetical protein
MQAQLLQTFQNNEIECLRRNSRHAAFSAYDYARGIRGQA